MTGIASGTNNNIIDTPEQRYLKYKETAEKYKIIQLGLVTWHMKSPNNFIANPYTIYLFPSNHQDDSMLFCELSSMIFNRNQGSVDFNKWIYQGVSYLNDKQYKKLYADIIDDNINLYNPENKEEFKEVFPHNPADIKKCEDIIQDIMDNFILQKELKEYLIEKVPKFMLYYIVNHLPPGIKNNLFISVITLKKGKRVFLLTKVNKEEKEKMLKEEIENQLNLLSTTQKGAKNIYDALIEKKSILVGHNISLDILFLLSHFGPQLPTSYLSFKNLISQNFQCLFDTKIIYEDYQKISDIKLVADTHSVLDQMYPLLRSLHEKEVKITLQIKNGKKISYHNAGYDAYITGAVFLYLKNVYGDKIEQNFKNKIFIMKAVYKNFNIDNKSAEEEKLIEGSYIYSLRANHSKKTSDIDIMQILGEDIYSKLTHKMFVADNYNALIVMIVFDNNILTKENFESILNKHKKIFTWYSIEEFRRITRKNK